MGYNNCLWDSCSKFKLPSGAGVTESTASDKGFASARDNLGPFANMMLDSTDIAFRCGYSFAEMSCWFN